MTRGVVVTGIVLCAVAAPGCKHSSPKSFHDRAEAICAHYRQQFKQRNRSGRDEDREAIALFRSELVALRQLHPPPSQSATYRRWLAAVDSLARELERERVVLNRDEARVTAALRKEKVPRRPLTPAELEHPTAAILTRTLEPLPEWHAFVRDMNQIRRESKGLVGPVFRLAKQLELQDCLR